MTTVDLPLLPLGRGSDPATEPGVECPGDLPPASDPHLVERARAAKEALGDQVFVLGHHYQRDEVIQFADVTGDSFKLARDAAGRPDAPYIVFCGVHFMAETAAVLSPDKTVLIPDLNAGCSLADSITAEQLAAWKAAHPGAVVVMYVNTSAEVKALTDYCCTSSNAVQVVEHILREHGPGTEILFGPDMWLGSFVARTLGRPAGLYVWDGECHVHAGIRPQDIVRMRERHPHAEFLVHPECGCSTQVMEYVASGDIDPDGVHLLSTGQMLDHLKANPTGQFVVATEIGMLHPLAQAAPQAELIAANPCASCPFMKMITLEKLRDCLRDMTGQVTVPARIAERAIVPIERMVAIG